MCLCVFIYVCTMCVHLHVCVCSGRTRTQGLTLVGKYSTSEVRPQPWICMLKLNRKFTLSHFQFVQFLLYNFQHFNLQKQNEEHHRLLKGGPFKLNLYPKEYFDSNPYFSDKSLPPVKSEAKKQPLPKPFKPSSPGKKVS